MLNDKMSFALVQIRYRRWHQGDTIALHDLDLSVPSHKTWEDLLNPHTHESEDSHTLYHPTDSVFLEDCIELQFHSVSDWVDEWPSFFDFESESLGLQEFVEPEIPKILKLLDLSDYGSILTLWTISKIGKGNGMQPSTTKASLIRTKYVRY